jgi:putative nucleotidyltransferase-like protein
MPIRLEGVLGAELLHDDPEHELLLILAGTTERRRRGAERARELAAAADWTRLEKLLQLSRLFPGLGPRLAELVPAEACANFSQALSSARRTAGSEEIVLQLSIEQARSALRTRGIRSASLKGPLLGRVAYGEAGRRTSSDVDILVPQEALQDAVVALQELGYETPTDHVEADGLPLLHFTMVHGQKRLPPVELHWRIHWYEREFAQLHLLPPSPGSPSDWRPAPEAELAALLLFYARDGFVGLRYPADLGAWWDRNRPHLDAAAFEQILREHPLLRPALTTALTVSERTAGLPARELIGDRLPGPRGRLAVRLADPYPYPSVQQAYAEIGLIDGLLAPRGQLSEYVRRQVSPPPAVIREHAERADDQAVSRAGYSFRTLARYALALSRVAGLRAGRRARFAQ